MRFRNLIFLLALLSPGFTWADGSKETNGAIGDRVSCARLLAEVKPRKGKAAAVGNTDPQLLASVLKELRGKDNKPVPLTILEFETHVREVALYLLGQKNPEQMKNNFFFSEAEGRLNFEWYRGKSEIVRAAVDALLEKEIKKVEYDGKTAAKVIEELKGEKKVLIFTHQTTPLQDKTDEVIGKYPDLKGVRAVWLVGAESSHPLKTEHVAEARLVNHSVGGEFNFKLSAAENVVIAGGAMDYCLASTIVSIANNTKAKEVTVEVIMPLTYLDLQIANKDRMRGKHATLSELLAEGEEKAAEYGSEVRGELRHSFEDFGFTPLPITQVPGSYPSFAFKNDKGRVIRIVFRR